MPRLLWRAGHRAFFVTAALRRSTLLIPPPTPPAQLYQFASFSTTTLCRMSDYLTNDVRIEVPGTALLQLASDMVDALNRKIIAEEKEKLASGQEEAAHELYEQRVDLSVTQSCIDPYRWAMDKAEHGREIERHEESPDTSTRLKQLFDLGTIPKAAVVIPQAVALRRQTRELGEEAGQREDTMLDFLEYLASHRLSKDLFRLSDK